MQVLYHATSDRVFHRRMASSAWGTWRENIEVNQGAAEGDMIYRSASAWTRLAKGAANQLLRINSGATSPEWGVALDVSGSAPAYACRAWVNFNGQGAVSIRGSGNVTSITDNGTGNYTVNFTTDMPDANFATVVAASRVGADGYAGVANNRTTTSVSVLTYEAGNFVDQAEVSVAVFR